jgi:hypothetical protein
MSSAMADIETPDMPETLENPDTGLPVRSKVFALMLVGLVFAFALAVAMIFDVESPGPMNEAPAAHIRAAGDSLDVSGRRPCHV